ncbi:vacuolar protein [Cryptococcus deuterogattii 2001/935-1]|nr:vacuolar protein [Cryptococcus deuterogattii 2001/935-1]
MAGRQGRKSSKVDQFFERVPRYFSYLILISAWLLFILFITFGEVLIKRREIGRFLEQVITFNTLFFFTVLSLITTSLRSPGTPDHTLAPTSAPGFDLVSQKQKRKQPSSKNGSYPAQHPLETFKPKPNTKVEPPPSLIFLRNSQWISSRLHKDRPSPLPLFKNEPYPPVPSALDSLSLEDDNSGCQSGGMGWSDPESESESGSDYSPFPFSPSAGNDSRDEDEDRNEHDRECDQLLTLEEGHAHTHADMNGQTNSSTSSPIPTRDSNAGPSDKTHSRWCKRCNAWKPDRAHHCRDCGSCVLKMDHHCPWLGTCVGYRNYKPFLLFITYATLLATYTTFETGYEVYLYFFCPFDHSAPASPYQSGLSSNSSLPGPVAAPLPLGLAVSMMLLTMGVFMTLSVGGLACFHWWLAAGNMTTLESITHSYPTSLLFSLPLRPAPPSHSHSPSRQKLSYKERQSLSQKAQGINVYGLGWRRNLKEVFFGNDDNRHRGSDLGHGGWDEDNDKRVTIGMILGAMWPSKIGYDKSDPLAGHVFPYDPCALEQLKMLSEKLRSSTLTLRVGGENVSAVGNGCNQNKEDEYQEEENAIGFGDKNRTGSGRYEAMDEKSAVQDPDKWTQKKKSPLLMKNRGRGVQWFEV